MFELNDTTRLNPFGLGGMARPPDRQTNYELLSYRRCRHYADDDNNCINGIDGTTRRFPPPLLV